MSNKFLKLFLGGLLVTSIALCTACKPHGSSEESSSEESEISASVEEEQQPSLKIDFTSLTLDIYDEVRLSVTGTESAVTWNSSNSNVATVTQDGIVNARTAGSADITATADGETVTCRITVRNQGIVPMLVFVNEEIAIVESTSLALGASVTFKNQTMDCPITYSSANTTIATVDEKGVVKGVSVGETIITVTAVVNNTLILSDSIQVTVRNIENI